MLDPSPECRIGPHVIDPQKPNVIFSSNVPTRVANCVAEMHLFLGGKTSRLVDVAPSVGELEVVLEVNSLLQRNGALAPFELVRRNLVFVAKSKNPYKSIKAGPRSLDVLDTKGFTGVWKEVLAHKHPSEVFVASFRLTLDRLIIDLANANNMTVEFHQDDLFGLLATCEGMVEEISTYLRHCLLAELKSNTDISTDISNSSTILQELPFNELASVIKNMHSKNLFALESASFIDTTLEGMDSLVEKHIVFEDDDFDLSGDDIKILHSDDSGKCTADEDDIPGRSRRNSVSREDIQEILKCVDFGTKDKGHSHEGAIHIDDHGQDNNQDIYSHENRGQSNIQNVNQDNCQDVYHFNRQEARSLVSTHIRHTEESKEDEESKFISDLQSSEHKQYGRDKNSPKADLSYDVEGINIDDYTPEHSPHKDDAYLHGDDAYLQEENEKDFQNTPSKSPPMILNESSPISSRPASPIRPAPTTLMSPIRPGHIISQKTSTPETELRKKSSFAYISNDDNSGLQFAFRDTSEDVPSFIKENKKFKFIKVGKVQKFVSLFEEQMDKEGNDVGGSNVGSRVSTRPGSPLKKGG